MTEPHEIAEIINDPTTHQKWLRRCILLGGLLSMCGIVWLFWRFLEQRNPHFLNEDGSPIFFFTILALLPAVGFPATPLYLLAGATYGKLIGLIGTLISIAVNQALCYWLARHRMRPVISRLLQWAGIRLPEVERKNELRFTVLVKLTPGVPAFVKNYLLGLAEVSFGIFFPVSFLIAGLYASSFVVLGESMMESDFRTAAPALIFLIAATVGTFWWRRNHQESRPD